VGTIDKLEGTVDIVVQRKDRGKSRGIWLFSKETLDAIPLLYKEVNQVSVEQILPAFLTEHKVLNITLFGWLAVLLGMPLIYISIGVLDKLVSPLATRMWHSLRGRKITANLHIFPKPARLLLLVLVIRWTVANVSLALLTRQFWSNIATVITIGACVWLAFIFNGWIEHRARKRLGAGSSRGGISVLRLARRTLDLLVLFAGIILTLYFFDVNVTAALAGLGVGGIAIALAAQKTLENVVGGISIIADQAVRVGDALKVGDTTGTVEDIGLRSTRIRTLDRTMVSIPNAQISTARLEDLSSRDKFWFHPVLSLQYETTAAQMRSVLEAIRNLLLEHSHVEADSVRVRFLGFGSSSLDVDLFAYVSVPDFGMFLEVQEELLLRIMDAVQAAGTRIALPSQTTYVAANSTVERADVSGVLNARALSSSALSTSPQTS
jgi:MscS family membrane protein